MILSGIPDPLRQLPDMHAVLDVAEAIWTEHMDDKQYAQFCRDLYRQESFTPDGDLVEIPAGFEPDDEMASFDAFAALTGD